MATAEPAAPSADGDLRFTNVLTDGRTVTARRVLVATGPASVHHAWLFRQQTDDLIDFTYFTRGTELDADTRTRLAARNIRTVQTHVREVVNEEGARAEVRLTDRTFVERRILAVVTQMRARTEGLERPPPTPTPRLPPHRRPPADT